MRPVLTLVAQLFGYLLWAASCILPWKQMSENEVWIYIFLAGCEGFFKRKCKYFMRKSKRFSQCNSLYCHEGCMGLQTVYWWFYGGSLSSCVILGVWVCALLFFLSCLLVGWLVIFPGLGREGRSQQGRLNLTREFSCRKDEECACEWTRTTILCNREICCLEYL